MALYVTISMESAPANQVLLVTSVTNVNMDNMDFPTVTVSFCNFRRRRRDSIIPKTSGKATSGKSYEFSTKKTISIPNIMV